ncbi:MULTISPECIES: PepSY-associated TM helix domain-containing protein [unclassified Aureimonas]|uniref:PepSY-associated TM helix domain-containing protein n=1 Tax=unclassified Aureimonas TaxID=2615206 RepID=UPI0006FC6572|nr:MULTISPECIES: PepSY-associated TM helix domain-containing protein [unclassified Aureimonas]KQT64058.1 hypothetical protein ASG62_03310 [Aureimonas sp. Leaf427]KQT81250.1 hypothetical protein ASG54_00580 [Aureimonas sp. Leaf460]
MSGRSESGTRPQGPAFKLFVARLHLFAGLLVGPFLFAAALTGVLYAATPEIEAHLYRGALRTESLGTPRTLAEQAEAAIAHAGPETPLLGIRPATEEGATTRVLFSDPSLGASRSRAVFVDPVTLAIRGDLTAYGSSGILPFRTALDEMHRSLLLGEPGRLYSELAASWLWILALGGIALWIWRRAWRPAPSPALRVRRRHGTTGVTIAAGLLFLSATGLTWSGWAGGRIDALRSATGWTTPSVSLALDGAAPVAPAGEHAHHGMDGMAPEPGPAPHEPATDLDRVLSAARAGGLQSAFVEIRVPKPGQAWLVREYDRSWPTDVDTLAIDPRSLAITDRADFASFPLVAKLIQWGIAAHMGVLFGLANRLVLAALGLALATTILYGYRIWWRGRPRGTGRTLAESWLDLGAGLRALTLALAVILGWALPMVGLSLAAFALVDALRFRLARRAVRGSPAEARG